jgi:hypothetical protein
MISTRGPHFGTQEVVVLQEKCLTGRGPTRLGAQMSSNGFFLVPSADKYCHNGGMAFGHSSRTDANRRQLWGSTIGAHGPHRSTLRSSRFAGKSPRAPGADAFGCANGLEWLDLDSRVSDLEDSLAGLQDETGKSTLESDVEDAADKLDALCSALLAEGGGFEDVYLASC